MKKLLTIFCILITIKTSFAQWTTTGSDVYTTGKVGIGTNAPTKTLDVRGDMVIESGHNPYLYAGTGSVELNRYIELLNSTGLGSAAGLKAGGILASDLYSYASPTKGQIIAKDQILINTTAAMGFRLAVNGDIRAKEIKVETGWSDFVFLPDYHLRSLSETEHFIKENGHLPEIPSAKDVAENGIYLGEMNSKLLQKIEELTLHLIQLRKEFDQLKLATGAK